MEEQTPDLSEYANSLRAKRKPQRDRSGFNRFALGAFLVVAGCLGTGCASQAELPLDRYGCNPILPGVEVELPYTANGDGPSVAIARSSDRNVLEVENRGDTVLLRTGARGSADLYLVSTQSGSERRYDVIVTEPDELRMSVPRFEVGDVFHVLEGVDTHLDFGLFFEDESMLGGHEELRFLPDSLEVESGGDYASVRIDALFSGTIDADFRGRQRRRTFVDRVPATEMQLAYFDNFDGFMRAELATLFDNFPVHYENADIYVEGIPLGRGEELEYEAGKELFLIEFEIGGFIFQDEVGAASFDSFAVL